MPDHLSSVIAIVSHIIEKHPELCEHVRRLAVKSYPRVYDELAGPSRNPLGYKIKDYVNRRDGFFIELGANNGITQSNTFLLERDLGWKGILIEPILHNFLLCMQYRSDQTKKFCCACVSNEYTRDYVELYYSNLMTVATDLRLDVSDPLAHAKSGEGYLEHPTAGTKFIAPARTLNAILLEANAPRVIDFLSLDVEGAELEVLQGVDHNLFRFDLICVESREEERLARFLADCGYRLSQKITHLDYLFEPINP
jgi:FkbM family methyltransferase